MACVVDGALDIRFQQDIDGHRTYDVDWHVISSDPYNDGPLTARSASGLSAVGDAWYWGDTEVDAWAYCIPECQVSKKHDNQESDPYWVVTQTFTTKPIFRCQDSSIENPLSEPFAISGAFATYREDKPNDRDGYAILNSAKQRPSKDATERDGSRPTVKIAFNSATLPLDLFQGAIHTLNDAELWGVPEKCVKLSEITWERLLYGTCTYYYRISYGFEINWDTWDEEYLDYGKMELIPQPDGDSTDPDVYRRNPKNYRVYKDINGEPCEVLLDGSGSPLLNADSPVFLKANKYALSNLLLLGIPSSLT